MQNINVSLKPGVPMPFQVKGTILQILSSGDSAGLTVQFFQGGRVAYTINDVMTGWKLKPQGGFDALAIASATADTISAIVTAGDVDIQILNNESVVTNTAANPVVVTLDGGSVNVSASNVGINNTDENPVPVSLVSDVDGTALPVTVGNTSANPVPVSLVSEPGAPVAVTVGNAAGNPVPVSGSMTIGNGTNAPVPVSIIESVQIDASSVTASDPLAVEEVAGAQRALTGQSFTGVTGTPTVASGMYSYAQLWNPAGSGKNLIVQQVNASNGGSGVVSPIWLAFSQIEAATLEMAGVSKLSSGAAGVGQVRNGDSASLPNAIGGVNPGTIGQTATYPMGDPFIIAPGWGLNVAIGSQDLSMWAGFEWYEQ